ncbi:DMT family transporter [Pseudaquabacterium pictum]|uniref:Multidrug DMT transporter permease n=1 Tax=Pseudaquabacterium pictum TaxID=2315236 RepID=A0A480AMR9_9BURK|nr:DMT family transporter [Rubrivivax pictus]GCL62663.1 multidrug DMT transporter permease [Rubrivivax pictus]
MTTLPLQARWVGPLLAMAGAVAFSGKAIIVKLAYRHGVDAVTLIMLRMAVALPFFLLMCWWAGRGRTPLPWRDRWIAAALGFSGYYLSSFLDFLGLQHITASLERLILYLTPSVVLLLSWALYGRRASARQWLAMALAYFGLVLVFGHELTLEGPRVALGTALVVASTLSYAGYLLYSGEVVQRIGALRLTGWASAVACVLCLAQFALLRPLAGVADIPAPVLWLSLVNGTLCTVLPVLMVMMAIERIGSAKAAQYGMVGPVTTIAMGVLILGEPFTAWVAAGTLCVLGGVALLARTR